MDDIFIPLWPPAWVEDYALSNEQLVAVGEGRQAHQCGSL
jgi:hypothetical protein